jgi:hypothetical protein
MPQAAVGVAAGSPYKRKSASLYHWGFTPWVIAIVTANVTTAAQSPFFGTPPVSVPSTFGGHRPISCARLGTGDSGICTADFGRPP